MRVRFMPKPEVIEVVPYSEMYGFRQRTLVATRHGVFRRASVGSDPYTGRAAERMSKRKGQCGRHVDFDKVGALPCAEVLASTAGGYAWERSARDSEAAVLLHAMRTPPAQNKWARKRIGAKKVKRLEKLPSDAP